MLFIIDSPLSAHKWALAPNALHGSTAAPPSLAVCFCSSWNKAARITRASRSSRLVLQIPRGSFTPTWLRVQQSPASLLKSSFNSNGSPADSVLASPLANRGKKGSAAARAEGSMASGAAEQQTAAQAALRRALADIWASQKYSHAVGKLTKMSLGFCHSRHVAKRRPHQWSVQNVTQDCSFQPSQQAREQSIDEQIMYAMARHHPLDSLDADLPLDVRLAVEWVLLQRAEIHQLRAERFTLLSEMSDSLQGWSSHLLSFSPSHIKACTLPEPHVALINALVHALDWPHLLLSEQLFFGAHLPLVTSLTLMYLERKLCLPRRTTVTSITKLGRFRS
eukprot:42548-Pleurochrysis_carterae.AAC.1